MKKIFCTLLAGTVLFNCNFKVHGVYTYGELLNMGLRNNLEDVNTQELLSPGNLSTDEIYEFLTMGIFSLRDIVAFHSRGISTETVRNYLSTGIDVNRESGVSSVYYIPGEKQKIALEVHDAQSIISLVEKGIDVDIVTFFVSNGVKNPKDIISMIENDISIETLKAYQSTGADIGSYNLNIDSLVFFDENGVSSDVVHEYVKAGIRNSDDMVLFYQNGVSPDTVHKYMDMKVDMKERNFEPESQKLGISGILSLMQHNVPDDVICAYVNEGVRRPSEIVFLVEHNVPVNVVHDYNATGVHGVVPLIEHNVPIELVSGYVNVGLNSASKIISAIENKVSVEALAAYKDAHLLNWYSDSMFNAILSLIKKGVPAEVVTSYNAAGIEHLEEIFLLLEHNIPPEVVHEYLSVGLIFEWPLLFGFRVYNPGELTQESLDGYSDIQNLVQLIENKVPLDLIRSYVDLGVKTPRDVCILIKNEITPEMVSEYLSTGLKVQEFMGFEDLVLLVKKNVSVEAVRNYVVQGIDNLRDIVQYC